VENVRLYRVYARDRDHGTHTGPENTLFSLGLSPFPVRNVIRDDARPVCSQPGQWSTIRRRRRMGPLEFYRTHDFELLGSIYI